MTTYERESARATERERDRARQRERDSVRHTERGVEGGGEGPPRPAAGARRVPAFSVSVSARESESERARERARASDREKERERERERGRKGPSCGSSAPRSYVSYLFLGIQIPGLSISF